MYAWLVVISLLFIVVALVTCKEEKVMNCKACKFAVNGVCKKEPKPFIKPENACVYFIKQRSK